MLSENIKNLRKEKGMSQEELASKLNVVRQTVSKWEQNLSVPDSEMLIRLAEIFEVSVSCLLGETVEKSDTKTELEKISQKLENLNTMLAERNMRSRRIGLTVTAVAVMVIAVLMLIYTVALIVGSVIAVSSSSSIGIIGGADGPTAIMISSNLSWLEIAAGITLSVVLICVFAVIMKKIKK